MMTKKKLMSELTSNDGKNDGFIDALGRDMTLNCLIRCPISTYPVLTLLNKSIRSLIRSGEIYRLRKQEGLTDYRLYFSYGGCDQWKSIFDLSTNRWMHFSGPSLFDLTYTNIFYLSTPLVVGNEILVHGRGAWSSGICTYDIVADSWSLTGLKFDRRKFAYASNGTIAVFAGGYECFVDGMSSAEIYDSDSKTWRILPDMNKPRRCCAGVFMDDKIYVIGGFEHRYRKDEILTCGEEYDFKTNNWTSIPGLSPVREISSPKDVTPFVAVVDNELYAVDFDVDKDIKKYDKQKRTWIKIGDLPDEFFVKGVQKYEFKGCGCRLITVILVHENDIFDENYISNEDAISYIKIYSCIPSESSINWNVLGTDWHSVNLVNFEVAVYEY